MQIGWVGTGIMGGRMVMRLLQSGHHVRVHDRIESSAAPLIEAGAVWARTPHEAATDADFAFIMVAYPWQVEEVVFDAQDGVLEGIPTAGVIIDCTTSSPDLERRIAAEAHSRGIEALDAPVSGGPQGAQDGTLSFMVGGQEGTFQRGLPLLKLMGKEINLIGPSGAGQHAKMVNQIMLASNMMGVCEAFMYARKTGLSLDSVFDSVSGGAAQSFILNFAWPRISDNDLEAGFYVEHFLKDLGIVLAEAGNRDLCLPATSLARQLYHSARACGGIKKGTQALILALESLNGIHNPNDKGGR